jgi:acyl transferase
MDSNGKHVLLAGDLALEEAVMTCSGARSLYSWRLTPPCGGKSGSVVLAPGFGQTMTHLSTLALYLANAGFVVYRYDPFNHVGLSSGSVRSFTMRSALESMQIMVKSILAESAGSNQIGLIASSLGARVAYRFVGVELSLSFLITIAGVVNLRHTLVQILGTDWFEVDNDALPETIEVEGYPVTAQPFCRDCVSEDWLSLESTEREIRTMKTRLTAFMASEDLWVRHEDAVKAHRSLVHPGSKNVLLAGATHNSSNNPRATRVLLNTVTDVACEAAAVGKRSEGEPSFGTIVASALREKRLFRQRVAEVSR